MTNPPIKVFPSEPQKPNQRLFFIRNDYSFKTLDNLYVCVMVCVGNVLQIHTISTAHKKKKKTKAGRAFYRSLSLSSACQRRMQK